MSKQTIEEMRSDYEFAITSHIEDGATLKDILTSLGQAVATASYGMSRQQRRGIVKHLSTAIKDHQKYNNEDFPKSFIKDKDDGETKASNT